MSSQLRNRLEVANRALTHTAIYREVLEATNFSHTRGKNFLLNLTTCASREEGLVKGTETRQESTHKKTTLLKKNGGKDRLKDYSKSCNGCRVVDSVPQFFCSRVVFLCFQSLPCFCTFYRPIPTCS